MNFFDIVKECTDDFCESFTSGCFNDIFSKLVAGGILPNYIDATDPRVVEIISKCKLANPTYSTTEWAQS